MPETPEINIIGAGLAGCEAAWQAAERGVKVKLFEMKPVKFSPAHSDKNFAELVCSNSFKAKSIENAVGLLKKELETGGSLIIEAAYASQVPAGGALAVDRDNFAGYITDKIKSHRNIEVIIGEVGKIDLNKINIIATGPLTSESLHEEIRLLIGGEYLEFFDAAAPIVSMDSIDFVSEGGAFYASRYDKGDKDYINCPLTKEEYEIFHKALISAQTVKLRGFETEYIEKNVFEGCMPVEITAKRGEETLLFGCMKPVGITDPKTGKQPYAAVQLRQDNKEGTMYNIVGFQTNLTFPEQKRVFSLIPALKNCEFLRYGVMHRNTFINSPELLDNCYNLKENGNIYFAGQITGTEGYVCSAASGFSAGIAAASKILGLPGYIFPKSTAIGALAHYISGGSMHRFQPMGINFGIIENPEITGKIKGGKKFIRQKIAEISLEYMTNWRNSQKHLEKLPGM
ncbi:MAG: methylenetetrahydrofolate--tRNA-(uracil(54)-C(5))-methyltransferase (FADH(2)-oxidizing) TrmFO [Oscillospiraceae bacterium]|nr:methylenetetrahydrofolate--tRNA-(uracil(54)-C(5))-methyltransferase (FADH(2)-oxidizing) TrmFO [Oscillospiraceae bacterium]